MSQNKGKFIVIEGVRGAGKSTVMKFLKDKYSKENKNGIHFTREPGGSPLAEKIRTVMLDEDARQANAETQFGLIWAGRADHLKNTIRPALAEGKLVISDRFDTSTYALQVYAQEAPHLDQLFFIVRDLFLADTKPDLYIILDVDPQIGLKRVQERKENYTHFHDREPQYYERMRKGYHEFAKHVPHVFIDANKSLEEVRDSVLAAIERA